MTKIPRSLRWLLILGVLLAGALLPRWISQRGAGSAEQLSTESVLPRVPVQVEIVQPSLLEERLKATGTVLANEQVDIVSEIAGKVEEVLFEEGTYVTRGTVLVRLDTSTLAAERERARHRVGLLERQEARQRRLLEDGLLSQEDYDFTVGELNVLRSELELRSAQFDKAVIRAPFEGIVGLRGVSPGTFVSSQTRVTSLQDVDPVKIEFSVPESYARDVSVGDTIHFRMQGLTQDYSGTVYALEPAIDPETRSLTVRARAPNPERLLLPGAFAEVELAVRSVADALSVPSMAVIPELGGKKVFLLADGVAEPRVVETGIRTADRVQITQGLEPGDSVIVTNIPRLARGVEVEVVGP